MKKPSNNTYSKIHNENVIVLVLLYLPPSVFGLFVSTLAKTTNLKFVFNDRLLNLRKQFTVALMCALFFFAS